MSQTTVIRLSRFPLLLLALLLLAYHLSESSAAPVHVGIAPMQMLHTLSSLSTERVRSAMQHVKLHLHLHASRVEPHAQSDPSTCLAFYSNALQAVQTIANGDPDSVSAACQAASRNLRVYDAALMALNSSSSMSISSQGPCTQAAQRASYDAKLPAVCTVTATYTASALAAFKAAIATVTPAGNMIAADMGFQMRLVFAMRLPDGTTDGFFEDLTHTQRNMMGVNPQACTIADLQAQLAQLTSATAVLNRGLNEFSQCMQDYGAAHHVQMSTDAKLAVSLTMYPLFDANNHPVLGSAIRGAATTTPSGARSLLHGGSAWHVSGMLALAVGAAAVIVMLSQHHLSAF